MYKFLFGIFLLGFGTLSGGIGIAAMGGAIGIPGIVIAILGGYLIVSSISKFFSRKK
jgi:hypothetical protein